MSAQSNILLIYTGGTIGMIRDNDRDSWKPFDFENIYNHIPELNQLNVNLSYHSFGKPIDSSDMSPVRWSELAGIIENRYEEFDGFVILHGSDTMAYTASALSFMLENLDKPVILTGSQLPIGVIRTDAKENLFTSIEVAATKHDSLPVVKEVCIYFEYQLYRGNRTLKVNAEYFEAFESPNYPTLMQAGVNLKFNYNALMTGKPNNPLKVHHNLCPDVAILKLFPGITLELVRSILQNKHIKAVVLETFGSGNATTAPWFRQELSNAINDEKIILNITQCHGGSVNQGKYEASRGLHEAGVVSGKDMTTEAAVTKLMYLMGENLPMGEIRNLLQVPLRGEITA